MPVQPNWIVTVGMGKETTWGTAVAAGTSRVRVPRERTTSATRPATKNVGRLMMATPKASPAMMPPRRPSAPCPIPWQAR